MPPPEHRGEDARRDEDTRGEDARRSESEESRHGPTRRSREALEDERQRGRRRTERSASRERPRDVSPSYADTNRKPSGRNDRRKCDVCGQMVGGGEFGYMNHCQTSKFHMTWKFHSRGLPWNQAAARANKEWHNLNPAMSVPGSSVPPDRHRRSLSLRSVRPAEPARAPKRPRVPEPSQPPRRLQTASGRAPSQEERPKERFVGRSRSRKHDKDRTRRRRKSHGSRDTSRRRRRDRSKTPAEATEHRAIVAPRYQGKKKTNQDQERPRAASVRGRSVPRGTAAKSKAATHVKEEKSDSSEKEDVLVEEEEAESEEPESDQEEEDPSARDRRLAELKKQTLSPGPAKKVPEPASAKPKAVAKAKAVLQPAGKKKPAGKSAAAKPVVQAPVVQAPVDTTVQPTGSSSSSTTTTTLASIAALYEAQAAIMRSLSDH